MHKTLLGLISCRKYLLAPHFWPYQTLLEQGCKSWGVTSHHLEIIAHALFLSLVR
jgi:hypothetical protein